MGIFILFIGQKPKSLPTIMVFQKKKIETILQTITIHKPLLSKRIRMISESANIWNFVWKPRNWHLTISQYSSTLIRLIKCGKLEVPCAIEGVNNLHCASQTPDTLYKSNELRLVLATPVYPASCQWLQTSTYLQSEPSLIYTHLHLFKERGS